MGGLCSKESNAYDGVSQNGQQKEEQRMVAPLKEEVKVGLHDSKNEGSARSRFKTTLEKNISSVRPAIVEENPKTTIIERPKDGHHRHLTMDSSKVERMYHVASIPHRATAEHVAVGWPSWLVSVAGEAIKGWTPRSTDSYEKLSKIGQGTYSSVYMARDITNDKIVAMKKVRFVNMDPESVRFMAREINILCRLDHPNVMKLEALVTSRVSGNLYLVFEYMEHDLAGLLASPMGAQFTEPQIKCFMKQILCGLEHCHNRGILHRDIKGANLLVNGKGNLKIGDFGLANFYKPRQNQPLTSRVVTLWYRAPELLLGATEYGPAIDLWSVGCIFAELFAGKPIMPGRTEVEQLHKIFKLCGSPTEEYWRKVKFPHASSFKSQRSYKRRISDAFRDFPPSALALLEVLLSIDPEERGTASSALKSEFFTTNPLPCDPSCLPKYPPSKEFDVRMREEARQRDECLKGNGTESAKNDSRTQKIIPLAQSNKSNLQEDSETGFHLQPPRINKQGGLNHPNTTIHPRAVGYSWSNKLKDDSGHPASARALSSSHHGQDSQVHQPREDSVVCLPEATGMVYHNGLTKRNRMHFSGPLLPPGGNVEDMLKEHERQIQEAVRKARMGKERAK